MLLCTPEHGSLGNIEHPVNRGQSFIFISDGEKSVINPGNALLKVCCIHAGYAASIAPVKEGLAQVLLHQLPRMISHLYMQCNILRLAVNNLR